MQDESAGQRQFQKMTQAPVPRLIVTLAIPTIFTMLITAVYNMADTFFVARLGTSAAGAVGIVFAMMAIIQSLGFMIGMGSGKPGRARSANAGRKKADEFVSTAFVMAIGAGTLLWQQVWSLRNASWFSLAQRLRSFLTRRTMRDISFSDSVHVLLLLLNNLLRSEGKRSLRHNRHRVRRPAEYCPGPPSFSTFKLGISGAAIATLISQCISFSMAPFFRFGKEHHKAFHPPCCNTYGRLSSDSEHRFPLVLPSGTGKHLHRSP
ncbi:MAG: MATE family efflux transporter [Victivallales bacterium]